MLWANLHLLFWLSLFPFTTGWMGENHFPPAPTAVYGVVLLMAAIAYYILQSAIIASEGRDSLLAAAIGKRLERKTVPCALSPCHPARVCEPVGFERSVCARGTDLAGSRPPHRTRGGEKEKE